MQIKICMDAAQIFTQNGLLKQNVGKRHFHVEG
jgi:hypothetical protein